MLDVTNDEVAVTRKIAPDGSQVRCLMLANEKVAIARDIVEVSGAMLAYRLLVIWLFEDSAALCMYELSDDIIARLEVAGTSGSVQAHLRERGAARSPNVEQDTKYIQVFNAADMRRKMRCGPY
ncbi:hypothetical protein [Burkholderia sp. PU8-34]